MSSYIHVSWAAGLQTHILVICRLAGSISISTASAFNTRSLHSWPSPNLPQVATSMDCMPSLTPGLTLFMCKDGYDHYNANPRMREWFVSFVCRNTWAWGSEGLGGSDLSTAGDSFHWFLGLDSHQRREQNLSPWITHPLPRCRASVSSLSSLHTSPSKSPGLDDSLPAAYLRRASSSSPPLPWGTTVQGSLLPWNRYWV